MSENRQSQRYPYHAETMIDDPDIDGATLRGFAVDISLGGLRVSVNGEIALGRVTELSLALPDNSTLVLYVMIIWSAPTDDRWLHGLRIMELDPKTERQWGALIALQEQG